MLPRGLFEWCMDALRPGWRERQQRRKTPWHLAKILLMFALLGALWLAAFRLMWRVHLFLHPEHAGHLDAFWRKGIGGQAFVASALLVLPLFLPALGISMTLTNLLLWCIAPARLAFAREAIGEPERDEGPEPEMTFDASTLALARLTAMYL